MKRLNILFLDIEGGHGGSSRSLFNTLKYIDRENINPIIICKKEGFVESYKKLNIPCFVEKTMPTFTVLNKENRNFLYYIFFLFYIWPRSKKFRIKILKVITDRKINLVHCNLISLFLLAKWLKKKRPELVFTLHVRTNPFNNITGKYQAKIANLVFDNKVFITENEKIKMNDLISPKTASGEVIYNSVETKNRFLKNKIDKDINKIKIISLSNYSFFRGTDRIIDLARIIPEEFKEKFIFFILGDYKLPRFLPGKLKILALKGKTLKDYAESQKVSHMIRFMGHVKNPEKFIKESNILIRPTREYNPWGRDVLEAMSFGKAIISVGSYDKFVKNEVNGFLQKEFDLEKLSKWLVNVAENSKILSVYGKNSLAIVKKLNNPENSAKKLEKFWINSYSKIKK